MESNDYQQPLPTQDEVMTLPAGGRTDALVARHVLGWRWDEKLGTWYGRHGESKPLVPSFSEDIADAWSLCSAVAAGVSLRGPLTDWDGPRFKPAHIHWPGTVANDVGWYVDVTALGYCGVLFARTAPLAICRAALWCAVHGCSVPNVGG